MEAQVLNADRPVESLRPVMALRRWYQENEALAVLSFAILLTELGFGMITPVQGLFARDLGASISFVGVVIAIYGLGRFVANVPVGLAADRFGRKPVFTLGAALTGVASLTMAVAPNLGVLLFGRLLAGVAAAMMLLCGQIMVSDSSTVRDRGRKIAIYMGFFLLGADIGPLPGGVISDAWGLRAVFFAYAAIMVVVTALALGRLKETRPVRRSMAAREEQRDAPRGEAGGEAGAAVDERAAAGPAPRGLRSKAFVLVVAVSFSFFFTRTGVLQNVIPLFGVESLGLSKTQVGLAFTIGRLPSFLGLFVVAMLADRYGRKPLLVPGALGAVVAVALWAQADGFAIFMLSSLMWGLASSVSGAIPVIYVADIVRPEQSARALSLLRTISDLGYFVGPIGISFAASWQGYPFAITLGAIVIAVATIPFWLLAPESLARRREGDGAEHG